MGSDTGWGSGGKRCLIVKLTKETTTTIKNAGMEYSYGRMETHLKGIILMTIGMAMERCTTPVER